MSEQRVGYHVSQPAFLSGVPLSEQVRLSVSEHETIRQIVREEIANALRVHQQRGLDLLLEAVQGEPDPDDEMAAVLATLTEDEWNVLVERVKGMKRE